MTDSNEHEDRFLGNSRCWNCGSSSYYQTVSTEHCPSCGIRCDYWGGGANEKYESAHRAKNAAAERRMQEKFDEEWG